MPPPAPFRPSLQRPLARGEGSNPSQGTPTLAERLEETLTTDTGRLISAGASLFLLLAVVLALRLAKTSAPSMRHVRLNEEEERQGQEERRPARQEGTPGAHPPPHSAVVVMGHINLGQGCPGTGG